jgi:hypothetical protein
MKRNLHRQIFQKRILNGLKIFFAHQTSSCDSEETHSYIALYEEAVIKVPKRALENLILFMTCTETQSSRAKLAARNGLNNAAVGVVEVDFVHQKIL